MTPVSGADYRAANRQDQKECSDKLGEILVHTSILSRHSLKKARQISNWTLVLSRLNKTERWDEEKVTLTQRHYVPLIHDASETDNCLRQATNFIQINSRMIAPMSDMMKPAG
jgi:hypothetical protein